MNHRQASGKLDVQCEGYWFDHGVKGMLYLYSFTESGQGLFIVNVVEWHMASDAWIYRLMRA